MKTSELIKGLQSIIDAHGDLPVEICMATPPDKPNMAADELFLRVEHYVEPKTMDVISISDFPY